MADEEEEVEEIPDLPRPTRWGLAVIGLSLAARVTSHVSSAVEEAAEIVEEAAKFWCELAMWCAGAANHETSQREFAEQAAIEIETLVSGASNASSGQPGGH